MNAADILKYGHLTLMKALEDLPESALQTPTVCGFWSSQDVVAHLASYETMLVEILTNLATPCATPTLDHYLNANSRFNDEQVAMRKHLTYSEILAEYQTAHEATLVAIGQLTTELLRQPGFLAWYGADYSLDDFLVYTYYGHKREHSAQILVFRDSLSQR